MSQDSSGNETQPEASRAVSDAWRDMPSAASSTDGNDLAIRPGGKTPLFEAFNSGRYQRQTMIREIQNATGRMLLRACSKIT